MTMFNWPTWPDPSFENTEPGAAFLRGAGQRYGQQNLSNSVFGRYIESQRNPYQNAFAFANRLNPPAEGQNQGAFQNFANWNSPGDVNQSAMKSFSQLAGGSAPSGIANQYMQPEEEQATDLRNLAVQALMSRISPLALQGLRLPSGTQLRDQFLNQTGGQPGGDFIQYLRSQLGLGML